MDPDIVEVISSNCYTVSVSTNTCGGGSVDTSSFLTTGDAASLYYPRNDNISGYITSSAASGVTSLNTLAGVVSLTGRGGTVITLSGQYIQISGGSSVSNDAGLNVLSGNLYQTGSNLYQLIIGASGLVNLDNYNIVYKTGNQLISGNKSFSGVLYSDYISGLHSNNSIDVNNAKLKVGTGVKLRWDIGQAYDSNNTFSIDWDNKVLFNNEWPIVDWQNQSLTEYLGGIAANWNLRYLYDSSGNYSVGWNNRQLFNPSDGTISVDWKNKILSGTWTTSGIKATFITGYSSTVGLDLQNGIIYVGNLPSADFNSKQLNNNLGNPTVRWNNYILNDSSQNPAADWNNRLLKTDAVTTTIDWSGKIITGGTWNAQAIRVSGASLITGIDTGSFASITNLLYTGQNLYNIITGFSGVFNRSNRVTGISVTGGNYITGGITIWAGDGIEVLQSGYDIIISTPIAETGGTVLDGQLLIGASGTNSYEQGNLYGYSGIAIISGSGSLGVGVNATIATASNLYTTGQTLYTYITNTSGNLNNRLYQTGANLFALISASSAGVGSLNAQSGALVLTGAGNVTVIVNGQNFTISGYTGDYVNFAQKTALENTGISLKSTIDLVSGNLITTGVNLGSKIDSLSGWVNNTSRVSSISITGFSPAFTGQIGISGIGNVTVFTGINNSILISGASSNSSVDHGDGINLSGNLTSTGASLYNNIIGFSGVFNSTGVAVQTQFTNLSNNLQTTGQTLDNKINSWGVRQLNGLSGQLTISGAGNITAQNSGVNTIFISGDISTLATINNLYSTGSTLDNKINTTNTNLTNTGASLYNNISTLTTNLVATGSALDGKINILSGYSNNNFATINSLSNFGVKSLNNISGNLFISGVNQIQVVQSGVNTLFVSGVDIATVTNLTSTGITLTNNIIGLSGVLNSDIVNLQSTGSVLYNDIFGLSGSLNSTGNNLQTQINTLNSSPKVTGISVTGYNSFTGAIGISGLGNVTVFTGVNNSILISGSSIAGALDHGDGINISGNLQSTGQSLYNYIINLSGAFNATGNNLYLDIIGLSGIVNTDIANLQTTGSNLYSFINNFSGVFNTSGNNWQSQLNTLNNLPKVTGIYITGGFSHTGAIQLTGNNGLSIYDSGSNNIVVFALPSFSKSLTLEYPVSGDSITMFYTDVALRLKKAVVLLSGSSNQFVNFNYRFATGRHVLPYYSAFTNNQSGTSITTGDLYTVFDNSLISGNSYVWLDITSTGGALNKFHQTIFYNYI